jgi:hypothetical protein
VSHIIQKKNVSAKTVCVSINPVNPVRAIYIVCTMDPELQEDLKVDGIRGKWTRRSVRLPLDLHSAFEAGDLHDCTIRVGLDLHDSDSSYRVRLQSARDCIAE